MCFTLQTVVLRRPVQLQSKLCSFSMKLNLCACGRMLRCDKSKVFVPTRGKVFRSELTLEDQLAEAGWLLSLLALTQDQLDLLAENIAFLYLTGPPGTGEDGYIQSFQCTGCPEKNELIKLLI